MNIVHCQREKYTHYIGRPKGNGPMGFGNPFPITPFDSRDKVIADYENYARNNKHLLTLIRNLPADAVLGCWCHPKRCHGEVIIKLWEEMHLGV